MAEQDTTTLFEPPSGRINIYFLKEIWQHYQSLGNRNAPASTLEWKYINAVFNTLGIGLEPTIRYLKAQSPAFAAFEDWILQEGQVSQAMIDHFNSIIEQQVQGEYLPSEQVLTQAHLDQWQHSLITVPHQSHPEHRRTRMASRCLRILLRNRWHRWYQ
ncbi:MAG: hypothetical protein AAFY48_09420, partial [Bacteroidota bacterium]